MVRAKKNPSLRTNLGSRTAIANDLLIEAGRFFLDSCGLLDFGRLGLGLGFIKTRFERFHRAQQGQEQGMRSIGS